MSVPSKSSRAPALKILIVDDYADGAEALAVLLTVLGHAACVASDAADALRSFDHFKPDFTFIDIGLPAIDSIRLAQALRTRSDEHKSWLIALTGYSGVEAVGVSLETGFDYYLAKPVSIEHLSKLLGDAHAGDEPTDSI
jgi:DNA-binding response OmpR family regulator